jgi:hypothetical protein
MLTIEIVRRFYLVANASWKFFEGGLVQFGHGVAIYPGVTTLSGEKESRDQSGPERNISKRRSS